jgi:hypothetical protein
VTDRNRRFCRILLRQAMLDLTGREVAHFKANVRCTRVLFTRGEYLVEWPLMNASGGMFRFEVRADNSDHAKAQAINNWLEYHAEECRAKGYPPRDVDVVDLF